MTEYLKAHLVPQTCVWYTLHNPLQTVEIRKFLVVDNDC